KISRLGVMGLGKTLLVKLLQTILPSQDGKGNLGDPPPTRPTVVANLTGHGGSEKNHHPGAGGWCMGPIWSSYYGNCHSLLFMVDASNPTQLSASSAQLLGLLLAEQLEEASVLILFNKIDLPCYMTIEEMKSLIRLPDLIACTGLSEVLRWLQDIHRTNG
uniref:ADP-ribosylation factor-like 16 n=1 Tax=Phocoena sinus TaxID=42100 RepID=A0A8C9BQ61_PHOSS